MRERDRESSVPPMDRRKSSGTGNDVPGTNLRRLTVGILALALACLVAGGTAVAGPPYVTDDPEPVAFGHWEFYIASMADVSRDGATGTAPHVEINCGVVPDVQLHAIIPLAFSRSGEGAVGYGPGDIELGAKIRFMHESARLPMAGTFPLIELPTGDPAKGLGSGRLRGFLPLWLQKTVGAWTSYGGGGYWLNPGRENRNFWFVGWQLQRRLSDQATLGSEVYYTTAERVGAGGNLRANLGLVLDLTENHHLLVSGGRSVLGDRLFQGYLAYQLTL
jgi:hypothetical protein